MFAEDVEKTLDLLAKKLRGMRSRAKDFPDLREDYQRLVQAADERIGKYALSNVEADRMTNSLNSLGELVTKWVRTERGV